MNDAFVKALRPWVLILVVFVGVVAATTIDSFVGVVIFLVLVLGMLMVIVDRRSRKDGTAGMPVGRLDETFYRKVRKP